MLLRGFSWLVFFQLLGTVLNHLFLPILPGPIIGLLLLLVYLLIRGHVSEPLLAASGGILPYLPLLLIPPSVGVMVLADVLLGHFWAIVGALLLSLMLSIAFSAWLMQKLIDRRQTEEA